MKQHLYILLFLLIVFIPAVILSVLAIRSVNQEETVQRRRLEDALLIELDQTNSIINFTLDQIISELHNTIPDNPASEDWSDASDLAGISYILNPDGSIRYPDIDESDEANLFYWRYLNLFSNRESIPIYQNITREYEEDILSEKDKIVQEKKSHGEPAEASERYAAGDSAVISLQDLAVDSGKKLSADAPASAPAPASVSASAAAPSSGVSADSSILRSKSAQGLFESDTDVQERVYKKAEEEGQQYLQRNVLPQILPERRKENTQTVVRSVYIESTKYFEEIIQGSDYGIIPRLFDSSFILLYWERRGNIIAGCELDMKAVAERLGLAVLNPGNSIRHINILDHRGSPLIPMQEISAEKWRQPFVAKEISGLLPYWETAILLRSPEEFQKQIESSRYFLLYLILFLCLMIFTGITAIYQFSSARLRDVQQRVGFVTNVSHELKTPLTSIRMYSEMLSEGYQKDPEKIQKYSCYIASESQRLTRLINNVLDFAKLEKGTKVLNLETIDINSIIQELYNDMKEEYENLGFKINMELNPAPLPALCDRESIIQVLINLFSNVIKYSKEEKYLGIKTLSDGESAIIRITDKGIGVPKKYRNLIFREFYRIDNAITSDSKGTGLGLSIARRIMRQHSGDLVFSQADPGDYKAGSVFSLYLPAGRRTEDV